MTQRFIDQMKREVEVDVPPKRIISLVPSQTELLFDLGLEDEVVGITRFCIHPKSWYVTKTRVGGTKNINFEKVRSLKPDLIIANKEENRKEDIAKLSELAPVWISDVNSLEDAYEMIEQLGKLTATSDLADEMVRDIKKAMSGLKSIGKSVVYFIWREPYYVAGKETFIDAMLSAAGYENVCKAARYPSLDEIGVIQPDLVFLSSEPYPFSEQHLNEIRELFPHSEICLVDGEMFSWYGSRLRLAPSYFNLLADKFSGQ